MTRSNVTHTPIAPHQMLLDHLAESQSLVGQKIGEYRLVELLGAGGAGEVYLAEHTMIFSRVAIKVLRAEVAGSSYNIRRFLLEAQAANQIQSPHIVPVSDFGVLPDGRPYAVMAFLQGLSLDQLIRERAPMDLQHVVGLLRQVAEGMSAAHEAQIIHRDLKPANLFVEPNENQRFGLMRILDFGVAKVVPVGHDSTLTQHAGPLGTPRYAAPEQLNGGSVDQSCDVYALGTIAYEMLSGDTPFSGQPTDVITDKTLRDPKPLHELRSDLPKNFCQFVMHMTARRPQDRVQSMHEVLEFLDSPRSWGSAHSRTVKVQYAIGAALGVAIALGALTYWQVTSSRDTSNTTQELKPAATSPLAPPSLQSNSADPLFKPVVFEDSPSAEKLDASVLRKQKSQPASTNKRTKPLKKHKAVSQEEPPATISKPPETSAQAPESVTSPSKKSDRLLDPFQGD